MGRHVFGTSVQGASHVRSNRPCQDCSAIRSREFASFKKGRIKESYAGLDNETVLLSVADGHGSDSCPLSDRGAEIAVDVFCDIMAEFCFKYRDNMEALRTYLNREADTRLAKAIDSEWKKRVLNDHNRLVNIGRREKVLGPDGNPDKEGICKLYGTTLLGLVMTKDFNFAFQLGDGDITYIDNTGAKPVLEIEKILGVETHSLSKRDSWKSAVTRVINRDTEESMPFMYMITSDGMANSFISETEFHKNCYGYFEAIKEHGAEQVEKQLVDWLSETSKMGCGDDISAVIAYYAEE